MMNTLRRCIAVTIIALSAMAGDASAQVGERLAWPYRHMAIGNITFLGEWQPAVHIGYLFQPGLHRTRVSTGEFGEAVVTGVQWYAHALVAAGWTPDDDGFGSNGFSGLAQIGIVHLLRNDGPMSINRLGVVAQGTLAPRGIGPIGRIEFFHGNAAVSVGWMHLEEPRGNAFVVNVDLLRCILQDLGLVSVCGVL